VSKNSEALLYNQTIFGGLTLLPSITSFGDRPNDFETVVHYFRAHFQQVHRKNNEERRVLYSHFTSVIVRFYSQCYCPDI
jgi:hypothetical protein